MNNFVKRYSDVNKNQVMVALSFPVSGLKETVDFSSACDACDPEITRLQNKPLSTEDSFDLTEVMN